MTSPTQSLPADSWFQDMLGLPEDKWLLLPRDVTVVAASAAACPRKPRAAAVKKLRVRHLAVRNCVTGELHPAGGFRTVSIAELALAAPPSSPGPAVVIQIRARRRLGSHPSLFDVSLIQADPTLRERQVMVQVASNFNCLENSSEHVDPASGKYATNLMSDTTQGPAASSGAAAAAVIRAHAAFYDPGSDPHQWGQSLAHKRTVNLLDDAALRPLFPVDNGKVFTCKPADTTTVLTFAAGAAADTDALLGRVKVGLHCDAPVTHSRCAKKSSRGQCVRLPAPLNVIDQVFVSTANLGAGGVKALAPRVEWSRTRFLLLAAYVGTYAAAAVRGTDTLVLTLVGGGVFLNPVTDIAWALARAHKAWAPRTALRHVVLPVYMHDDDDAVDALVHAFAEQGLHTDVTWVD